MFQVLKSLPCDFFLGAHGNYFDMEAKYARLKEGAAVALHRPRGLQGVRCPEGASVPGRTGETESCRSSGSWFQVTEARIGRSSREHRWNTGGRSNR